MSPPAPVRQWLADETGTSYECRRCGTTLEAIERTCPTCGSTEIAEFDVS
jgi:rubrerythrin